MTNPIFIYISAWGLVLILYSLGCTVNIVEAPATGLIMVGMNMASIILAFILTNSRPTRAVEQSDDRLFVESVKSFLKFTLSVWAVGTLVEVIYDSGVPLYWRFAGIDRLYTEFGIPSFHGVMNAFFLQSLAMLMYLFVKLGRKAYLLWILVLLMWPVLMLGRGILLSGLLQMICVYLLMSRVSMVRIFTLGLVGVVFIVAFGVLGDMRQSANPFSHLVVSDMREEFDSLPSGFLWFYIYLTAGLSNVFHNVDTVVPGLSLSYTFFNMLPSVVKNVLDFEPRNDVFVFVDPSLNTSTIYAGPISDFGPVGGFLSVFFIQIVCCFTYSLCRSAKPWGIFAYTVSFQILIFSIFYDMFFLLPTLFQFAICFMMYNVYLAKRGKQRKLEMRSQQPSASMDSAAAIEAQRSAASFTGGPSPAKS